MTALIVNLTLEQSILATGLDGEPNSAVSQKFIPGSLIRGLAIQRYMAEKRLSELDLDDEETRRLFFSLQTRFLNAYPAIEGQRALPVPRTWRSQKYTLQKVFDEVYPSKPEDELKSEKRVKKTFALQTQEGVILHEPTFSVVVHTTRNRRAGKALEEDGAVFRYEALTEGQTFVAVVLCQNQDIKRLESLFRQDEVAYMGKARTAGYGRLKLGGLELSENWQEHKLPALRQQEVVLTLASHALLRNEFGHYSSDKSTIEKALQAILGQKISIKSLEVSSVTVGGFNRKWGLPLPQALALEMGSVIVLQNGEGLEDAFQKLADEGIGERRSEGFGRILVGWQGQATYLVRNAEQKSKPLDEPSLSERSQALKDFISRRIQRQQLDLALLERINKLAEEVKSLPSKSQLMSLRSKVQAALFEGNKNDMPAVSVSEVIQQFEEGSANYAKKAFAKAGLAGKSLLAWLKEDSAGEIEKLLREKGIRTDEKLKREYTLRLVDELLSRLSKQGSKQ